MWMKLVLSIQLTHQSRDLLIGQTEFLWEHIHYAQIGAEGEDVSLWFSAVFPTDWKRNIQRSS